NYNAELHKTSNFEISQQSVVIRRGQYFHIGLTLMEPYTQYDEIIAHFIYGDIETEGEKLVFVVPVRPKDQLSMKNKEWNAIIYKMNQDKVDMKIFPPVNIPVGRWTAKFINIHNKVRSEYIFPNLFVLFNPWNSDDDVYLRDDKEIFEYVANDVGVLYQGTEQNVVGKTWLFGQNKEIVFLAVMYLVEQMNLTPHQKANPAFVTRELSSAVQQLLKFFKNV
ncbi:hemocyte protein-glutamine gamma-glutamyltransferase-like protein, partial [Leptotrombidium deliense]